MLSQRVLKNLNGDATFVSRCEATKPRVIPGICVPSAILGPIPANISPAPWFVMLRFLVYCLAIRKLHFAILNSAGLLMILLSGDKTRSSGVPAIISRTFWG